MYCKIWHYVFSWSTYLVAWITWDDNPSIAFEGGCKTNDDPKGNKVDGKGSSLHCKQISSNHFPIRASSEKNAVERITHWAWPGRILPHTRPSKKKDKPDRKENLNKKTKSKKKNQHQDRPGKPIIWGYQATHNANKWVVSLQDHMCHFCGPSLTLLNAIYSSDCS